MSGISVKNQGECPSGSKQQRNDESKSKRTMRFKNNPLYHVLATLLEPTQMSSESNEENKNEFYFDLTAAQVRQILSSKSCTSGSYNVQVHLRCCVFDPEHQNGDQYPQKMRVMVNNFHLLMGEKSNKPFDISHLCALPKKGESMSSNQLLLSWKSNLAEVKDYNIAVFLVLRMNPEILLRRLQFKKIYGQNLAMPNSTSDVFDVSGSKETLICPIGMTKIHLPCRAETCSHFEYFDAMNYLKMNEVNPKWMCPICGQPAAFENLMIIQKIEMVPKDNRCVISEEDEDLIKVE